MANMQSGLYEEGIEQVKEVLRFGGRQIVGVALRCCWHWKADLTRLRKRHHAHWAYSPRKAKNFWSVNFTGFLVISIFPKRESGQFITLEDSRSELRLLSDGTTRCSRSAVHWQICFSPRRSSTVRTLISSEQGSSHQTMHTTSVARWRRRQLFCINKTASKRRPPRLWVHSRSMKNSGRRCI